MKMEKIIEIEGFYFEAILNGYFCSETRIKVSQKGIECGYMPLTKETAENRRKCWFAAQKLKQKIYAK